MRLLEIITIFSISTLTFNPIVYADSLQPISANSIEWSTFHTLPGSKLAILAGNPYKHEFFIVRIKLPPQFTVDPHHHSIAEHDTVITGTWHLGFGRNFDHGTELALSAGDYITIPANTIHYAWTDKETVLQISGIGPWRAIYLNPLSNIHK